MIKKLTLYILAALITSCFKQTPEKIESLTYDTNLYAERLEACSKVEIPAALLHKSTINFFGCTGWDTSHPKLFQALKNISEENWNSMTRPINSALIEEKESRDKLFSSIKTLDDSGGFDSIVEIVNSLNKQNFYTGLHAISSCLSGDKCREEKSLRRSDLRDFLSAINESHDVMPLVEKLLASILRQSDEDKSKVISILSEIARMKDFESHIVKILDDIFAEGEKASVSYQFLQNMSKGHIASSYLRKVDSSSLDQLKDYVLASPGLSFKLNLVQSLLENKIECEERITLNLKARTADLVKSTLELNIEKNLDAYAKSIAELKIADQICPGVDGPYSNHLDRTRSLKISDMLVETLALLSNKSNFQLSQKILEEIGTKDPVKIMAYLNNPAIVSLFELMSKNRASVDVINSILSEMNNEKSWDVILNTENVLGEIFLLLQKNKRYESLSRIWHFFNNEEKAFFVSFVFEHFKHAEKIYSVVGLYYDIWQIIKNKWSNILDEYYSKTDDQILAMISDISTNLKGEDVLEDFRSFFSKKNVFKILQTLTQGFLTNGTAQRDLNVEGWDNVSIPKDPFDSSGIDISSTTIACLNEFARASGGLSRLGAFVSSNCREVLSEFRDLKLALKFSDLGAVIDESHIPKSVQFGFLDRYGAFSANSIAHFLRLYSDGERKINIESVIRLINILKNFHKDKGLNSARESLVNSMPTYSSFESDISILTFPFTKTFLETLNLTSNDKIAESVFRYSEWLKSQERKSSLNLVIVNDEKFSCKKFFKPVGTGLSCPDEEVLIPTIRSIINDLLRNTGADHNAISLLINIMKSNSKNYKEIADLFKEDKFKISEIIQMMTDLHFNVLGEDILYQSDLSLEKDDLMVLNGFEKKLEAQFKEKSESFSVMEKIEAVTRNIRFDNNYLGTHFLNAIVLNESYDDLVQKKWKLLRMCSKLKFCGKWMSKEEIKLAENSVLFFKGLTEINSDQFKHSPAFRKFFSPFVLSSMPDVQSDSILKKRIMGINLEIPVLHKKKELDEHNGRILTRLTMVSFFTNLSRFIQRSILYYGTTVPVLLQSEKFNWFDRNFMSFENEDELTNSVVSLLNFLRSEGGASSLESLVKIIQDLPISTQQILEKSLFELFPIINKAGALTKTIQIVELFLRNVDVQKVGSLLVRKEGTELSKEIYSVIQMIKYFEETKSGEELIITYLNKTLDRIIAFDEQEKKDFFKSFTSLIDIFNKNDVATKAILKMSASLSDFLTRNAESIDEHLRLLAKYVVTAREFKYLSVLVADRLCIERGCFKNTHQNELFNFAIQYLFQRDDRLRKILDQITHEIDDEYIRSSLENAQASLEI